MAIKNLDKTGLGRVWANIKSYISSKLPTDYINGLSVSGKVITYTKADGTNGTITTQDTNTTYSNMSQTEADTGTATTARSISAKVLNTKIENKLADYALSSDIPTKTSELTNDSGFLASHQSLVNYVTTNTEQTITGNKLFKGYLRLIQSDLGSLGTAPTSNKYQAVNFYETTNTQRHAMLEYCYRTTGQNDIKIAIYNPQKTTDFASLVVGYDPKGVAFTKAVTPPDTSNSADIATTKWVVNKGYVDLSSNQIITGAKRFTGSGLYNANLVKGTLPTATSYINLAMSGSNAYTSSVHRIGLLESAIDTAGTVSTYITAYKFELGSKVATAIGVRYPLNSTPYAYAPNPDDGTSGQKIATTDWVTAKKYLTSHQDISGKQDKISTYVSNLTKSGNTLLIYTNGNTNSPSGSLSLNTTISGDVGTTVTAYYVGVTGNATGSDSWTNSATGASSVTAPSRSKTFSYTPTVGSIYSGSYLASAKSGSGTLTNTYTITSTSAKLLTVSKQVISATATYTRPYSSSYKYLCTTASTSSTTITGASETETYPTTTTVTEGSTILSTVTCTVSTSSSKSTFLRVQ